MVGHAVTSVICLVPGCNNSSTTCPEKSYFQFSPNDERCLQWLLLCKREDLLEKEHFNPKQKFTVCSDHFTEDHFENGSYSILKDDAMPTLFQFNGTQPSDTKDFESHSFIIQGSEVLIKSEDGVFAEEMEGDGNEEDCLSANEDTSSLNLPHQLCRLCAKAASSMVYIYGTAGVELNLASRINISLPVTVNDTDPLPKQLCAFCIRKLNMCYDFAESCLEAESKLVTLMKLNHFRSHASKKLTVPELDITEQHNSRAKLSCLDTSNSNSGCIETEDVDPAKSDEYILPTNEELGHENDNKSSDGEVTHCDVSYSCPLCCEGNVNIQKDIQNVEEDVDVGIKNFKQLFKEAHNKKQKNKSSELDLPRKNNPNSLAGEMSQNDLNCETETTCVNTDTVVDEGWNVGNIAEGTEIIIETLNSDGSKDTQRLEYDNTNGDDLMETEECVQFDEDEEEEGEQDEDRNFSCCYICGRIFSSIKLCLAHSKHHFDVQNYPCSLCGIHYTNELDLANHCEQHKLEKGEFKCKGKRLTCETCFRRFNSAKTYFSHSCISPETKQFRCQVCKKSYSSEERLAFHQKFHEGAKLNYCDQCGKEFDNEGSLYYHTRMVHEGERPFCCNLCGKKFYSNSRLVAHKRVHTGERPFECEMCGRRFYDRETLKGHYVTHMSVKPYQCDLCGVCWGRKSLLNQHLRSHHSDAQMPRRVPSLIHYFCKLCNTTFTGSSDVLSHRATHWNASSSDSPHTCEYCGSVFSLVTDLGKHRKKDHPKEQPYVCSLCKETSRTLYEARVHRKAHTEPDLKMEEINENTPATFVCDACGMTFTERRRFLRHLKEHRTGASYQCKLCGKPFTDNQRLTVHMRLHTGEKPYPCPVCHKKFSQTSALYTHALLHTGEKPHSCDLCGKDFRIKADRDNHRRTHTGEKPYKCEFCGKTFRTGQVYYQHRMIHTGERRFPCDVCGKAFKRSHTLVVHKRIHTGEKPNICNVCGKAFRQRSDMTKHRSLHGSLD